MGLFKFMKEAGAKLFGGGEAKAATPEALKKEVQGHGFDANKINIAVEGAKVKLSGQAMTQEEAEKLILAVGNTVGVAEVDTSDLRSKSRSRSHDVHRAKGRHALEDRRDALRQGARGEAHGDREGQLSACEKP